MISNKVNIFKSSASADEMMDSIKKITSYHRIQASKGYREAAEYCCGLLRSYGLESEIITYPADYNENFLTMKSFEEWNCTTAYCDLVYPETMRLADFEINPLSLFQKSYPCDHRNSTLEIVLIQCEPDDLDEDLDLRGKVVFLRDNFNKYYKKTIEEKGAIGIITDFAGETIGIRNRDESMNILRYHTFWWTEEQVGNKPFGFVIDHEKGDILAEICTKTMESFILGKSDFKYPRISCYVGSEFSKGTIENVTAVIQGDTIEEILLVAHLCHPKPSANDNASGASAGIEAMRIIHQLMEKKEISKPIRTIRLILVPEYTGTFAYLQSRKRELWKIKAGLNLDIVGGNQCLGYGPLTLSGLPGSSQSFVMNLAELILTEVVKESEGFSGNARVPGINSHVAEFTTGSDNFILSDPTIGIPSPMLGQWPDKYYHTSGDSIEVISEKMMEKSASLAASYAYILADLCKDDIIEIAEKINSNMAVKLSELAAKISAGDASDIERSNGYGYILSKSLNSLYDIKRFFNPGHEVVNIIDKTAEYMGKAANDFCRHQKEIHPGSYNFTQDSIEISDKVPVRNYIGPVNNLMDSIPKDHPDAKRLIKELTELRKKLKDSYYTELMIQYHIDGRRTIDDIVTNVLLDCGSDDKEIVVEYIEFLIEIKLVSIFTEIDPK